MAAEFDPFTLHGPTAPQIPLVCDSPHSGTRYPKDFGHALPLPLLRRGEDTHVDALWHAIPSVGGTLLAANFPRTYVDPNRELQDLDPGLLGEPWPEPVTPSEKTRIGHGLLWRELERDRPIYVRQLAVAEVRARIDHYYRPYHAALARCIEDTAQRFGGVWHLNLHSMPGDAYERLGLRADRPLADFVLGDRDGTTCEPGFVDMVERALRALGYSVARNDPYKGVELIRRIGDRARNRHSLQVEVRRPLYMDEATREANEGFAAVRRDLAQVTKALAAYVRERAAA